jgi:hypothetical protein
MLYYNISRTITQFPFFTIEIYQLTKLKRMKKITTISTKDINKALGELEKRNIKYIGEVD